MTCKTSFALSLLVLICVAGCGGDKTGNNSSAPPPNNTALSVTSLSPESLPAGAASQTLTINGTGFLTTSTVTFNGLSHPVTYLSASQLSITLTTIDLATVGTYQVNVTNSASGSTSTVGITFTVTTSNPIPTISLLAPASLAVGITPQTLTISGTGFLSLSTVTFNGVAHTPTYVSASQLTILLTSADLALAGSYPVAVTNPVPGGGTSNSVNLFVNNLIPSIESLTPSTLPEASPDTQVQITGYNFLPSSKVSANSAIVASTYISATQLVATIPSGDLAIAGTVSISVTNPAPGGGTSPQTELSVGSQPTDGPGVQQDGTADPESLVYFVGPPATSSSGADSTQETNPTAGLKRSLSLTSPLSAGISPVDDPQHMCAEIGPDCVSGVPWAPQVQPAYGYNGPDGPGDWKHTANCGPASVLMVQSKLCSTKLDMLDELISLNNFLSEEANCPANSSCLFSSFAGQIDTNQVVDTASGTATLYNGRVVSDSANFDACMADPTGKACVGGGPSTPDLGRIAESYFGLSAQWNQISQYSGSSSTQDCASPMAWLQQELDEGIPVIVHVDYKLGLDPAVGNAGHYMVVVGIKGTSCTDTVYVVDPGVSNPANGDYSNQTAISAVNTSASAPCNGTTCTYTVSQFLQSWKRHNFDSLILSGSTACPSPQPPLGIVGSSLSSLTTGKVGIPYSATITANGGTQLYTWSIVSGQGILPPGIQLDASSGAISGTPTSNGAFPFTVSVTGPAVARHLDAYDILVRRNEAVPILEKVKAKGEPTLDGRVSSQKPFGLRTFFHGKPDPKRLKDPVKLFGSQKISWVERSAIPTNIAWIDKWKVLMTRVQGTSAAIETKFLSKPLVTEPGTACTESYVVAGLFDNEVEAKNYAGYLRTRFARFLVSLRKSTQDAPKNVYGFIPDLPLNRQWTDAMLYKRYRLTRAEIAFIESQVAEHDSELFDEIAAEEIEGE